MSIMETRLTIMLTALCAFTLALCGPAAGSAWAASSIPEDSHTAVIFAYHRIGEDQSPSSSIRVEQFKAHIDELVEDNYNVMPLPAIIEAFKAGADLPPRTVALTFDGGHASFLENAAPILEAHELPYTVFIVPGQTENKTSRTLGWHDLRRLEKTGLATVGLHPMAYMRLTHAPVEEIRRQINNARALYRKHLNHEPVLFAYPFGEYGRTYRKIIEESGFDAALGQQSGVAYSGSDRFALPRFVLTERFGDTERFQTLAGALPLPVTGIEPDEPSIGTTNPVIGFTVTDRLAGSLKGLSCYISGQERPGLEILGSRVELRLHDPVLQDRIRINCTLPGPQTAPEDLPVWRWFGLLLSVPENRNSALIREAGDEEPEEDEEGSGEISRGMDYPAP